MEIVIKKEKIIEALHKISAHLSSKLSATELVASTADDAEKIALLLSAASQELLGLLSPYAALSESDKEILFILDMPANWKNGRAENLAALCDSYLTYSLLARWLDFIKADSAALYRLLNKENATAIVHILSLREKPQRD